MATVTAADISYQAANESAKQQMDFQKMMSDTAHQREVADLRAAGLNPVLSAHGQGAQVTAGAAGYVGDENAKKFDEQVAAYNIEMKELEMRQALELLQAQTNAKVMLKSLDTLGKAVGKGSSGSGKSYGKGSSSKTSGSTSTGNGSTGSGNGLTGDEDIDKALENIGKRHPYLGLALAGAKYIVNNTTVGKYTAASGSSAKAKARYEENQKKALASNPDRQFAYVIHHGGR